MGHDRFLPQWKWCGHSERYWMIWETNTRVSEELSLANITPYRLTDPENEGTVIIRKVSDYLTVDRG